MCKAAQTPGSGGWKGLRGHPAPGGHAVFLGRKEALTAAGEQGWPAQRLRWPGPEGWHSHGPALPWHSSEGHPQTPYPEPRMGGHGPSRGESTAGQDTGAGRAGTGPLSEGRSSTPRPCPRHLHSPRTQGTHTPLALSTRLSQMKKPRHREAPWPARGHSAGKPGRGPSIQALRFDHLGRGIKCPPGAQTLTPRMKILEPCPPQHLTTGRRTSQMQGRGHHSPSRAQEGVLVRKLGPTLAGGPGWTGHTPVCLCSRVAVCGA